ncbi:MAG: holo-ACP synthase [Proteobacteria bacterium]|nr:holo-ACP synthase [Pseudomonadota bacterium]
MIVGIGTDIVALARIRAALDRHGERFVRHVLAPAEWQQWRERFATSGRDGSAWLARRWAAKEAFAKACGTGVRAPLTLDGIGVGHDGEGRPCFELSALIADFVAARGVQRMQLSLSDERDYAVAFVLFERDVAAPVPSPTPPFRPPLR